MFLFLFLILQTKHTTQKMNQNPQPVDMLEEMYEEEKNRECFEGNPLATPLLRRAGNTDYAQSLVLNKLRRVPHDQRFNKPYWTASVLSGMRFPAGQYELTRAAVFNESNPARSKEFYNHWWENTFGRLEGKQNEFAEDVNDVLNKHYKNPISIVFTELAKQPTEGTPMSAKFDVFWFSRKCADLYIPKLYDFKMHIENYSVKEFAELDALKRDVARLSARVTELEDAKMESERKRRKKQ